MYGLQFTDAGNRRFEVQSDFSTDTWLVNRGADAEPAFAWIQSHPFALYQAASRLEDTCRHKSRKQRP